MPHPEYSLSGTLERIYENQLALEVALMELPLLVERHGNAEAGGNVRGDICLESSHIGRKSKPHTDVHRDSN